MVSHGEIKAVGTWLVNQLAAGGVADAGPFDLDHVGAEPGQQLADRLYVVDPMGNGMMRFPAAMDTSGAARAKRDVERLLRASSSWDEPGRPGKP